MASSPSSPYLFDEFFASGKAESISPFLTPNSRGWGKNLTLRSALLSAVCLLVAFLSSYFSPGLYISSICLVYFLSGTPALIDSLEDIKKFEINIDVLMTLAAFLSIVIGSELEGALLLVLFEISGAMEDTVTHRTKGALNDLHELAPRSAYVLLPNGETIEKSVREIQPGQNLLIKAGEIVPLDSTVIAGGSFVSLKHLTGESEPIAKKVGDALPAGARNLDGTLSVTVTRSSTDSTVNRIIQLITQAQDAKPKLQRFLDRFGKWYALGIISLFFVFALTLPLFTQLPYLGYEGSIYRALTFLIAASPCALIIATPTAYLSAISSCAKKGILLKGGVILDALARCTRIAFDKTGTLTSGDLECTTLVQIGGEKKIDETTALALAASLEQHATHPIGNAICAFAQTKGLAKLPLRDFVTHPGLGLEASVMLNPEEWVQVYIGSAAFIREKDPTLPDTFANAVEHARTFLLVLPYKSIFAFSFSDALREEAIDAVGNLKRDHQLKLAMLTGDSQKNAQESGKKLGIEEIAASLRPEDKLLKVAEWAQEGLIMVGDGINDAPALARATVGISMGKVGSASAVEASDIVLIRDDLSVLNWLIHKSRKTLTIVKQNLLLALVVIFCATTPALLGWVPLWLAVILHEGGTVLVGLNSLRLLQR